MDALLSFAKIQINVVEDEEAGVSACDKSNSVCDGVIRNPSFKPFNCIEGDTNTCVTEHVDNSNTSTSDLEEKTQYESKYIGGTIANKCEHTNV
jgi:hypothetical protein